MPTLSYWILAWMTVVLADAAGLEFRDQGPHRAARLQFSTNGKPGFTFMEGNQTGIYFTNNLSEARSLTNQIFLNGSGVAAGDINGDGLCDLYFCGLDNRNELFLNQGNWRFQGVTDAAGVACAEQASTGAAFADVDGDGDLDLLVNGIAQGTRAFLNDGNGKFKEATKELGLGRTSGAASLAMADIDGDGFLDLYVVNYRSSTFRDEPEKRFRVNNSNGQFQLLTVDGRSVLEPDLLGRFSVNPITGVIENGEADALYRNRAGKRFERDDWTSGNFIDKEGRPMQAPYDWGLSAMFHDVNNDGAPDLYVCNDFQSEDRLWVNDGRGNFRLTTETALRHISLFSMGIDFADLDGDGRDELFVADMLSREHARRQRQLMDRGPMAALSASGRLPQYSRNTLFWNRGDGTYAEIGQLSGVAASEWSWCPAFLDVDLDGYPDLVITAGHARDAQNIDVSRAIEREQKEKKLPWRAQMELRKRFPKLAFPLMGFRNRGDLTFDFQQSEWGFDRPEVAQGMALADLDNDGDLDLAVNCLNGPALLYRNNSSANRLAIRLKGTPPNTAAIGAKISVVAPGLPAQSREITAGGRYLSSDETVASFATGNASNIVVRVRWRSGEETVLQNTLPNHLYEISELDAAPASAPPASTSAPFFTDVSTVLKHQHQEQLFDDFQRQPLLPFRLSTLGPGLAWFDADGDGWEELIIGSGRMGRIAIFKNNSGRLEPWQIDALCRPGTRDRTTLIGWQQGTNRAVVVGSANYEDGLTNGPAVRLFNFTAGTMDDSLPGFVDSSGPLAMGDADGDGDLDLFLGGRVTAARYPEPCSSHFFRNENGNFKLDEDLNGTFKMLGLISGATWSDLDGDGRHELLLACDGGPIRIFSLKGRTFAELTSQAGLAGWVGHWNSIATGDFDNDGNLDIIAGNWGRNTLHREHVAEGCITYYAPSEATRSVTLVEAHHDSQSGKVVPLDDLESLAPSLPQLLQRYPTFASFSTASISEVLGDEMERFREMRINTFETTLFLNRGGTFVPKQLPIAAQLSPVFGIAVGDVNADGNEDVFLAQNFFGLRQRSRYDAGRGVLLLGNGKGEFMAASTRESGVAIDGEGRAAAFCDFDHDGKLDLAVTQNSSATRLFKNTGAKRGIRIAFGGPQENPAGIGVSVRLKYLDGEFGPRHELHAGEGYWSQAGNCIVLGFAKEPASLEVRWGGRSVSTRINSGQTEIIVPTSP